LKFPIQQHREHWLQVPVIGIASIPSLCYDNPMNQIALSLPNKVQWDGDIPWRLCECGCGERTKRNANGTPRHYLRNHFTRKVQWIDGVPYRQCIACGEEEPISKFAKKTGAAFGKSRCLKCERKKDASYRRKYRKKRKQVEAINRMKKTYNITPDDYDKILASQQNACAICRATTNQKQARHFGIFDIDHCHDTNKIRGLLCGSCNRGIGQLKHSVDILKSAIAYLKRT